MSEPGAAHPMRLGDVIDAIRSLAPEHLAGSWDRVGLQVGDLDARIREAMLCIDLTEEVVDEAAGTGCGLVVAYHPVVFAPLRSVRADTAWAERRVWRCVREGLGVYSPHTALDAVRGGVCDWLAGRCGPGRSVPLEPVERGAAARFKLVVFVPEAAETAVASAVFDAGAGELGRYDRCGFSTGGTGGFRPLEGAEPAIGEVGQRATVAERRLEVLVPAARLGPVLQALRAAHPYEEPAFDVIRLEPEPEPVVDAAGAGRLLTLDEPVPLETLADRLRATFGVPLKIGGPADAAVRTVAVCPGSGGKLFEAVEADAYVTGEMQHHQALDLVQRGRAVVLGGHTHTERPYLPVYLDRIRATAAGGIGWRISEVDRAPLRIG